MRKTFTLVIIAFLASNIYAQNPSFVSTTPENRNIVLEEFTGIHCVYCPDGHRLGQLLYDNNPGDVVLINIHTGGYATPNPGEPDFRNDPDGAGIAGQASVSGYPAGTINRHVFAGMGQSGGTAMSRNNWDPAGAQILAQPSCVNVAAQAQIDVSSRVLTVDVEAYYTDNSTSTTNKINVVLLQNNVEGPQTGGASYNPTAMLPNGNYNHQHMFRHLLTGQWGQDIPSTTLGSLFQDTYTYTIPMDLNGVAYDLFNLEVAVFVSEGQQEVLSGNMASINHIVPPGTHLVDLGASTNMTMPTSLCDNNLTPEITVTNNSQMTVDTFQVSYTLNSNPPVTQDVFTPLAAGANTTITFPGISVHSGSNSISYSAGTLAGTSFIDNMPNNNLASSGSFNIIDPVAFATSHTEGFEGYANMHPAPNNTLLLNPQGHRVFIVDPTYTQGAYNGGFAATPNSFRWQFAQMSGGDFADLVFAKLDFSAFNGTGLSFSYAHAQSNGFDNNRLQVLVSTDCGATWNIQSELIGNALATTTPVATTGNFYPTANTWGDQIVDLSAYDGNAEVMIAFKGICAGGNNLYIDDISVEDGMMISNITNLNEENFNLSIYPNPVTSLGNIQLNIEKTTNLDISILDVLGNKVKTISNSKFSKGKHDISFNTTDLENGSYIIRCDSEDNTHNISFIITQ